MRVRVERLSRKIPSRGVTAVTGDYVRIEFSHGVMRSHRQAQQKAKGRPSRNGPLHGFRSAEMRPLTDMAERLGAGVVGHVLRLLGCKIVLLDLSLNLLRGMSIKSAG